MQSPKGVRQQARGHPSGRVHGVPHALLGPGTDDRVMLTIDTQH
jgi:hypothetical protein